MFLSGNSYPSFKTFSKYPHGDSIPSGLKPWGFQDKVQISSHGSCLSPPSSSALPPLPPFPRRPHCVPHLTGDLPCIVLSLVFDATVSSSLWEGQRAPSGLARGPGVRDVSSPAQATYGWIQLEEIV